MSRRRAWRRLFGLLVAVAVCGCGRPPGDSLPVAFDLAALFPLAERVRTTAAVAVGEEGTAVLVDGFGEHETDAGGAFVWGIGDGSEVILEVAAPQPLMLLLEGRAYPARRREQQVVRVLVNDTLLGVVEPGTEGVTVQLPVAAEVLRRGENRLQLRYRWSVRPADEDPAAADRRPLAVAWRRIGFDLPSGSEAPRATADPPRLGLPSGTAVSYYLELAPGARLAWETLRDWSRDGGELEVAWRPVDGEERRLLPRASDGGVDLPLSAAGLGRLSLAALGTGGIQLASPVVRALPVPAARRPATSFASVARGAPSPPLNVVLYVVDTLRADHLGCYGYPRPTSVAIDRFASDAALFDSATSPNAWTRPAVASILTGLLPEEHGVHDRRDRLPDAAETLAERLGTAGWATAGVITNGNLAGRFGLSQGFDRYRYLGENTRRPEVHKRAERVNQVAFEWLDQRPVDRPFLLYLHVTDPHAPYVPLDRWRQRFAPGSETADGALSLVASLERGDTVADEAMRRRLIDLYDAEIAGVDEAFGELLAKLGRLGVADSTIVVLTADHGEEFGEHGGWQHGETLFEEQLAVPLLIRIPGRPGGRVISRRVSIVDIVPTLLAAVGLPPSAALSGRSLLGAIVGPEALDERPVFASLAVDRRRLKAVIARQHKLLLYETPPRSGGAQQLFDLTGDPGELHDLAAQRPVWRGYLRTLLRAFGATRGFSSEEIELDEELAERLTALGYL